MKINKEIQRYQESILFGLSLRQMVFALLAIGVAVGAYFGLKPLIGAAEVGWVCMLAAFPFAMCGFFTYNGMPAERFLLANGIWYALIVLGLISWGVSLARKIAGR